MKYKLKVEIAFHDKYTNVAYKIGDVIEVGEARGLELLADPRKLVTLIEEVKETKSKASKKAKD